jgi:hypothetical protein
MTPETALTEEEALEQVAYLVSSAELAVIKPDLYGSFRLVDAKARVLAPLAEQAPPERQAFYAHLKHEIDDSKPRMTSSPPSRERSGTT